MQARLFSVDTVLLTSKVLLRRFRESEGKAFYELIRRNSSYVDDHFPHLLQMIQTAEEGEAFVRRKLGEWLLQESYSFGIWNTEEAKMIGYIHLSEIDWDLPVAEVSYFLDQNESGKGVMTEVLARVVQFGFKQLELEKIRLRTLVDNYPSQRLARKVGFQREGELRSEFRKPSGALLDLIQFGLTRELYGE